MPRLPALGTHHEARAWFFLKLTSLQLEAAAITDDVPIT